MPPPQVNIGGEIPPPPRRSPLSRPMPQFGQGGNLSEALKRTGDAPMVGEEGPEVAQRRRDGSVQIVPLRRRLTREDAPAPTNEPPAEATRPRRVFSRDAPPPPDFASLGIPANAVELQKMPVIENGQVVGYNAQEPGAMRRRLSRDIPPAAAPVSDVPAPTDAPPSEAAPQALRPRVFSRPMVDDAQRPTVDLPPGYDQSGATQTRERVARPVEFLGKRVNEDLTAPVVDHNGGRRSIILGGVRGFVEGVARTGSLAGGIGGAGAGALTHGLDHSLDERVARGELTQEDAARYKLARENEEVGLKADETRAGIRQRNAAATYAEARPDIEASKRADAAKKTQQSALQREIGNRLKEPRPFNPSDAYDSDLAARSQAAGVHFSPGMFGDFKNPATMEIEDPTDASHIRKTRVAYNRESGQWEPVTSGGEAIVTKRVQPVGANGMTPFQTAALGLDRDRLALSTRDYQLRLLQGLDSHAKSIFTTETAGLFNQLGSIKSATARIHEKVAAGDMFDDEGDAEIKKLEGEQGEIMQRIEAARSKALSGLGANSSAAPSTSSGRFANLPPMHRSNLPEAAKRMGVSVEEAQRRIIAEGGKIVD
jgi:hypothetical protein